MGGKFFREALADQIRLARIVAEREGLKGEVQTSRFDTRRGCHATSGERSFPLYASSQLVYENGYVYTYLDPDNGYFKVLVKKNDGSVSLGHFTKQDAGFLFKEDPAGSILMSDLYKSIKKKIIGSSEETILARFAAAVKATGGEGLLFRTDIPEGLRMLRQASNIEITAQMERLVCSQILAAKLPALLDRAQESHPASVRRLCVDLLSFSGPEDERRSLPKSERQLVKVPIKEVRQIVENELSRVAEKNGWIQEEVRAVLSFYLLNNISNR